MDTRTALAGLLLALTLDGCARTAPAEPDLSQSGRACVASCDAQAEYCGRVPNGCGGELDCGGCGAGLCGGSGVPNICAPYCTGPWCFEAPLPQSNAVDDVWESGPDDRWAVGEKGLILHFDGSVWSRVALSETSLFTSVWGTGSEDVWVAGEAVLHYDGTRWSHREDGLVPDTIVGDLGGTSPTDVYAVGAGVHHWDGQRWASIWQGDTRVNRLWIAAPDDVWIGGDFGVVQRWDGASWRDVGALGRDQHIRALGGTGPDDVWAAGYEGPAGPIHNMMLHWDGQAWSHVPLPPAVLPQTFVSIRALARDDAWAVGDDGAPIHWDGAAWARVALDTDVALHRVRGADRAHLWITGDNGLLAQWNGGGWEHALNVPSPGRALVLLSVWGAAAEDVWAVGDEEALHHRGPLGWVDLPSPAPGLALRSVHGTARDDVWLAASIAMTGGLYHWDGATWSQADLPSPAPVLTVHAFSRSDVWAAGRGGAVLHFDGSTWQEMSLPGAPDWQRLFGSGPSDLWLIGGEASHGSATVVVHWDGRAWSAPVSPLPGGHLSSGWSFGPRDAWLVGADPQGLGAALHWDGTGWQATPVEFWVQHTGVQLNDVWGRAPDDLWAACEGVVVHWDGRAWALESTPYGSLLTSIFGVGSDLWAAGLGGTVLHRAL